MNYYKQGNAAKAEQIKAAFESKGYNTAGWEFNVENGFYYTTERKRIDIACSNFLINLIKTHPDYQELELTSNPKLKVGNRVVSPNGSQYLIAYIDKENNRYLFEIDEYIGEPMHYEDIQVVDGQYHLWSIADARDGDVLVSRSGNPFIYNGNIEFSAAGAYVGVSRDGIIRLDIFPSKAWASIKDIKPATPKQRNLLFKKIQEAGYQWYAGKKELKKVVKPKFKVGDSLQSGSYWARVRRIDIENQRYICDFDNVIPFEEQELWNLVPNSKSHYDIANFQPFDKVLVRDTKYGKWNVNLFSYYIDDIDARIVARFRCINSTWIQCIPFNKYTKHLLGTTDPCGEEYINW